MSDNYETDEWLIDLFDRKMWYDPCPLHGITSSDGLKGRWPKWTFVNPPYSNPKPWVEKAIRHVKYSDDPATVVMLLKHDSSTEWYRLLHEAGAKFLMIQGRLKFRTKKPAPFPSVLVVLS